MGHRPWIQLRTLRASQAAAPDAQRVALGPVHPVPRRQRTGERLRQFGVTCPGALVASIEQLRRLSCSGGEHHPNALQGPPDPPWPLALGHQDTRPEQKQRWACQRIALRRMTSRLFLGPRPVACDAMNETRRPGQRSLTSAASFPAFLANGWRWPTAYSYWWFLFCFCLCFLLHLRYSKS